MLGCGLTLLIAIIAVVAYGGIWVGNLNMRMSDSARISQEVSDALKTAEPERPDDLLHVDHGYRRAQSR